MHDVHPIKDIPNGSKVTQGFGPISYADTFRIVRPLDESIDQITADIFTLPSWVNILMRMRNTLVRPFGLQTGDGRERKHAPDGHDGSRAMYFDVLERRENEIVMEEDDRHLKFRVSVFMNAEESAVYLTTLVHFNNVFGNIYFFIIKPFHKIIVKSLLKRTILLRQARMLA